MPSYGSMNKGELLDEADNRKLTVADNATNDEIIAALEADDRERNGPSAADMVKGGAPFINQQREGKFQKGQQGGDGGVAEVQEIMDEATDKGYFGYSPDPTPRENYGALNNDAPTPETDPDLKRKMRDAAGINQ